MTNAPARACAHCSAPVEGRARYCPDCRDAAAPWRVDDEALARACERLGLIARVVVRRVSTRNLAGRYHGIRIPDEAPSDPEEVARMSDEEIDGWMHHLITISSTLTPAAASRALWHELTHAAQFERDPELYSREYKREQREARALGRQGVPYAAAYRSISFEVEAKANEELHDLVEPLTRANRRCPTPGRSAPEAHVRDAIRRARRQLDAGRGPASAVDVRPSRWQRARRRARGA
jgi:hypothetical protein